MSPEEMQAILDSGKANQRSYFVNLLRQTMPSLPMFEDAAFAGSAAPSGFNAAELAAQYAQGPQDYTQAQGAARPSLSGITAEQREIVRAVAERQGYSDEALRQALLSGPTVPYGGEGPQSGREDRLTIQSLQQAMRGTASFRKFRDLYEQRPPPAEPSQGVSEEIPDPVWTDV